MSVGLKRGEVRLVPHEAAWRAAFEVEKTRLETLLGEAALAIEHIGSTAVPRLDAKPVIDIAIAVGSWDKIVSWPELLMPAGYAYFGDRKGLGDHFFAKGPDELRTHYLHVVIGASDRWRNYMKFRDALRNDAALRAEYQQLKRAAAVAHPNDRNTYTAAKDHWIKRLLAS